VDTKKKFPLTLAIVICMGSYIATKILLSKFFEKQVVVSHLLIGALVACGAFFLTWKVLYWFLERLSKKSVKNKNQETS